MKTPEYKLIERITEIYIVNIVSKDDKLMFDCGKNAFNHPLCIDCKLSMDCNEIFFVKVPTLKGKEAQEFKKEHPELFI